jgi:O-antigen/teichoic acid export membrane protein
VQGLSLRENFAWVLTGNLVFAACQWGMIVALAKLGSTFMVGQFSLGLAIATPVLMFTNLHLRAVQATDATRLYSFTEYLRLRLCMTAAAMLVITGIARFGHYERQTAMVILAVAAAKAIETFSDIHYGLFQLNDRLDQTGRSLMLRGVLSVIALTVGLALTRSVIWGCAALALVGLVALMFFDVRRGRRLAPASKRLICWPRPRRVRGLRRQWNLMQLALPLGIVTTLASLNLAMPRYFIHVWMGEHQLGIFSAMAYTTVAMTLVSDSLGHCSIPRMSRLYAGGQMAEFRWLLVRLLAVGAALGVSGLLVARLLGERLLALLYGPEYAAQSRVLLLLILAMAIQCVACMFTSAILSARHFRLQLPIYGLSMGTGALACWFWVPAWGLTGGAAAMVVASVVHLILGATAVSYLLSAPAKHGERVSAQPFFKQWEPGL